MSQRGLQYRIDRASQRIEPQRRLDAWALRHPLVENVACGLLPVGLAVLLGLALNAWYGAVIGLAIGVLAIVRVKANHRRRVANGTSAQFGPPSRPLD